MWCRSKISEPHFDVWDTLRECEQDDPFHVYEHTVVLRSPPRACTSNAGKTGSHLKWSLVNVTPCENTRRRLCPCLSAWSSGYHIRFIIVRSRVQSPACAHCFLAWTLSFVITRTKKRRFLLGYKISRSSGSSPVSYVHRPNERTKSSTLAEPCHSRLSPCHPRLPHF